jgi:GT2 family glycosyltransferase
MFSRDLVSITIVTYNSGRFIRKCLEAALGQKYPQLEIIVVDNGSTDGTVDLLEDFEERCLVIYNNDNAGFAAAQNQAIAASRGDWVLTLNPDVFLLPGFIDALMEGARLDPTVGTVCGKLFSMSPGFEIPEEPIVDSTGIYFTPMLRHFDRGSQQCNNGHFLHYEYVFGATAAAACYRREMIEDVSVDGEFFDPDFFAYREDADLAWRAQLLGWKCIYVPYARAYHVRKLRPGMRRKVPAEINMHCVKNRFLMRLKNVTPGLYWRNLIPITVRDLGIAAYCLVGEQTSIKAFFLTVRNLRRVLAKRRWIQERRRVDDAYIEQWFRFNPVSLPVEAEPEAATAKIRAASGH